jgi:hypothetical protein
LSEFRQDVTSSPAAQSPAIARVLRASLINSNRSKRAELTGPGT